MSRRVLRAAVLTGGAALGVWGVTIAARRKLNELDPVQDLSGASIPLDTPGRPPLGASVDARMLPPAWEPPALRALARWEPRAPRHPLARAAAYAWAAPLTLAGLAAGCLAGVRPEVREGVLLFARARGPAGAVLRSRRYAAGAVGHVVIAVGDPGPGLFAHELVHVRHAERLGPLTVPVYLALLGVYGYARHPLERAARRAARRAAERPAVSSRPSAPGGEQAS